MTKENARHLTYENRCHIEAYLKSGKSNRSIAQLLGFSHTAINKEINRNKGLKGYFQQEAHENYLKRGLERRPKRKKITGTSLEIVKKMLTENQWSPVQISGRLGLEEGIKISHEIIYQFIWQDKKEGGFLYKYLRHKAKKYNKRSGKQAGRGLIPNRVDISERPPDVEKKERFGDFELDTIVGAHHQGAIVSIVDRASKYVFLGLVPKATAANVASSICQSLHLLSKKSLVQTMTSDNGKEFAAHEKIVQTIGGAFYFAKPYHSWERGLNEHTNGLVRQYFPKGTDFTTLTKERVAEVERKLNNRPRKILNFETPREALFRLTRLQLGGNLET